MSTPRLAGPEDATLMSEIHAAAFPPEEAWSRDIFSLQLRLPNVLSILQENSGLILARLAGDEAEILTLAVLPVARLRGIARGLLRLAIARLAACGASAVFLEVSVANTAGLSLYLSQGFTEAGRRKAYYHDRSDALVLRLDIQ